MKFPDKSLFFAVCMSFTATLCPTITNNFGGKLQPMANAQTDNEQPTTDAQEYYRRARELSKQGQTQEAIAEYTKAIELDPDYALAYVFRGNALALVGQPQKGIEDIQKGAEIYASKGDSEAAEGVRQYAEKIREGMERGEL